MIPSCVRSKETILKKQTRLLAKTIRESQLQHAEISSAPQHFFVAGLGNPSWPNSRQSLGQVVLRSLADKFGVKLEHDKQAKCMYGGTTINLSPNTQKGETMSLQYRVSFLLPKESMFEMGRPIRTTIRKTYTPATPQIELARKLRIGVKHDDIWREYNPLITSRLIVLHDTFDLEQMTCSGEPATLEAVHPGVVSILNAFMASLAFGRVLLGIGHPTGDIGRFLTDDLSRKEIDFWSKEGTELVWKLVQERIAVISTQNIKDPFL